jgi:Ser/Thr protein kinase RdoA (MazF antagonist)
MMNKAASGFAAEARLPKRGPGHYLNLLRSAHDTILSNFANPALRANDLALLKTIVAYCEHLSDHWSRLACVCDGMPQTLVHGDFIEKNVRVRTGQDGPIFLAFDWEKAGWGVAAEDISTVDIPTYWSTVQDHWPQLNIQALERLANVGRIFRCLVFLDWLAPSLEYEDVDQPLNDLRLCESWLADLVWTTEGPG